MKLYQDEKDRFQLGEVRLGWVGLGQAWNTKVCWVRFGHISLGEVRLDLYT